MVSIDEFIGVLRSYLLATKGAEMDLHPAMPLVSLEMSPAEWGRFSKCARHRLHLSINTYLFSISTMTLLDLYFDALLDAAVNADPPSAAPRVPAPDWWRYPQCSSNLLH